MHVGDQVRSAVNTPAQIGTEDETGYILMFFNRERHEGKSTFISSETDRTSLKRLLQFAIDALDGPKASIIEPPTRQ